MCFYRTEREEKSQLINQFANLSLDSSTEIQTREVVQSQTQIVTERYGILNALESFLNALVHYDEVNPQFFAEEGTFAEPSFVSQEL